MTVEIAGFRLVIAIVTFVGSATSCFGTGFIVLCYLVLPLKTHFRHALILNLAVADFINSTANTVTGLYILITRHYVPQSNACIASGMLGQVSVQATDVSILAIAVITVLSITKPQSVGLWRERWKQALVVAAIWILPLTTGFTGLGLDLYGPVSGNWCWLKAEPTYLRYVLTHGWRFLIILIVVLLYVYLHFFLRAHYKDLNAHQNLPQTTTTTSTSSSDHETSLFRGLDRIKTKFHHDREKKENPDRDSWRTPLNSETSDDMELQSAPAAAEVERREIPKPQEAQQKKVKDVRKVLLMRAYPTLYVLLWLPGIVNRFVEASGHSSRVTALLQASTQFVGFANAITYGWNERIPLQMRGVWRRRCERRASLAEDGRGWV